jgi:GT2 family glycosyltransferase
MEVVVFTYERGPLFALESAARLDAPVTLCDASVSPARREEHARRARALGVRPLAAPGASLAAQRNVALRSARDARVAFLDDDCLPRPGWLDALGAALDGAEVATSRVVAPPLLSGAFGRFFDQDHGARSRTFTRRNLRILPARPLAPYAGSSGVAPWAVGSGSSFAVRREDALRLGGFREDLGVGTPARSGEDIEFFFRALHAGQRIRYAADAIVDHHHVRRSREDFLGTAHAYARGGREFLRRAMRRRPGYALVLLGRPAQLLAIAARCLVEGDRETAAMCGAAFRGWVGLPR